MEEKVRGTTSYVPQIYGEKGNKMVDRLSALPEEIVVAILSLLTMKEAARTSVLSQSWKNLWNFYTGSLVFDASKVMVRMIQEIGKLNLPSVETERAEYISWVNRILDLHQGQTIEEFKLCFDLNREFAPVIDRWLNFAMEKRVRRLEVNLRQYTDCHQSVNCYTFPLSPLGALSFNTLTALYLKSVDLTDDALAHLLSNCPLIEELSFVESRSLVNLKIGGSCLKLKYLELSYCLGLQNVEVSVTNLVSFKYFGYNIKNPFRNVPMLSEVSVGSPYSQHLVGTAFFYFSGVLSQLVTLVLDMDFLVYERVWVPNIFPEFCNLKQLELRLRTYPDHSTLSLTSLIGASPCLYRFVMKFRFSRFGDTYPEQLLIREVTCLGGKPRKGRIWPHQCLKVVELVGWVGHTNDTDLAVFLLENAVLLDKIIIDPRYPETSKRWELAELESKGRESRDAARARAKQLETKLRPGTELVIL